MNKIFCGNCLEIMNDKLEPNSIDLIITSPPYNIGVKYNSYNDNLPFDKYLKFMNDFGKACSRVLKREGSLFFNIGDKPTDEFRSFETAKSVRGNNLKLQNTFHWIKSIAVPEHNINIGHFKPTNSKRYTNNCHEYIFHFSMDGNSTLDKMSLGVPYADKSNINRFKHSNGIDKRDRGNQWFIPYKTVVSQKEHPASFPERLPEMCIKIAGYSNKNEAVVLDPFCGSGSTCVTAKRLNCKYIGIDIDQHYIELTLKKLNQFQSCLS